MLLAVGGVLAAAFIGWSTYALVGLLAHSTESAAVRWATADGTPIRRIVVDSSAGIVSLQGADSGDVAGERVVHRGLQAPDVRQDVVGDTLYLTARCTFWNAQWCGVDWLLRVPRDVSVSGSSNHGTLRVTDVHGPLRLDSTAGEISVQGTDGRLELQSTAGEIRATDLRSAEVRAATRAGSISLAFTSAPRSVDATSSAGEIDIGVPGDGTTYRVRADSSAGDTDVRIPTDPASTRQITAESRGGSVTVRTAGR